MGQNLTRKTTEEMWAECGDEPTEEQIRSADLMAEAFYAKERSLLATAIARQSLAVGGNTNAVRFYISLWSSSMIHFSYAGWRRLF